MRRYPGLRPWLLSAPSHPLRFGAVAYCRFPASKANLINRISFEAFSPILSSRIQEKDLPFTVAGQQWFFTIFPSVLKRN
jgi:hypothetical protein